MKRAQIALPGGGAFDCVVEDLSAAGAKVRRRAALALLRGAWFFGNERLRRAAADLELAHVRFRAALTPHVS